MDNFTQQYNLDRKAASRLLKVSVRTVDRYVKKKVLTAQNVGGRVWLNKEEVNGFAERQNQPYQMPTSDTHDTLSTPVTTIDILEDTTHEEPQRLSTSQNPRTVKTAPTGQFFKTLYDKTKEELNEKQERLEIANYRVGQLEAQLKNSIPLLEYHREAAEKKLEKAKMSQQIEIARKTLQNLAKRLKFAEYNKKMFLTILLVILALQPLWLLLLAK
jgi:excisionase family DNA binding protein